MTTGKPWAITLTWIGVAAGMLGCLFAASGCAFTIAETMGGKKVRGINVEMTASERMEQAVANKLDPLAREMLDIEQQKTILGYYSQVSGDWTFDEARKALETARGMLFPMPTEDAPDEGTSGEPEPE